MKGGSATKIVLDVCDIADCVWCRCVVLTRDDTTGACDGSFFCVKSRKGISNTSES